MQSMDDKNNRRNFDDSSKSHEEKNSKPVGIVQGVSQQTNRTQFPFLPTNQIENIEVITNTNHDVINIQNNNTIVMPTVTISEPMDLNSEGVTNSVQSLIDAIRSGQIIQFPYENTYQPGAINSLSSIDDISNANDFSNYLQFQVLFGSNPNLPSFNIQRFDVNVGGNIPSNRVSNRRRYFSSFRSRRLNALHRQTSPLSISRNETQTSEPIVVNEILPINEQQMTSNVGEVITDPSNVLNTSINNPTQEISTLFETPRPEINQHSNTDGNPVNCNEGSFSTAIWINEENLPSMSYKPRNSSSVQKRNRHYVKKRFTRKSCYGYSSETSSDEALIKKHREYSRKRNNIRSKLSRTTSTDKIIKTDKFDKMSIKQTEINQSFNKSCGNISEDRMDEEEKEFSPIIQIPLHQLIAIVRNGINDDIFARTPMSFNNTNLWYNQMIRIPYIYVQGMENRSLSWTENYISRILEDEKFTITSSDEDSNKANTHDKRNDENH